MNHQSSREIRNYVIETFLSEVGTLGDEAKDLIRKRQDLHAAGDQIGSEIKDVKDVAVAAARKVKSLGSKAKVKLGQIKQKMFTPKKVSVKPTKVTVKPKVTVKTSAEKVTPQPTPTKKPEPSQASSRKDTIKPVGVVDTTKQVKTTIKKVV